MVILFNNELAGNDIFGFSDVLGSSLEEDLFHNNIQSGCIFRPLCFLFFVSFFTSLVDSVAFGPVAISAFIMKLESSVLSKDAAPFDVVTGLSIVLVCHVESQV